MGKIKGSYEALKDVDPNDIIEIIKKVIKNKGLKKITMAKETGLASRTVHQSNIGIDRSWPINFLLVHFLPMHRENTV